MALICDTGPLFAAMDRSDPDHRPCLELLSRTDESLVVPSPVLVELEWLLTSRIGAGSFDTVLADISDGNLRVEELARADYSRARDLCETYLSLPLGFVDAGVVAITERLKETKLATLDRRHFSVVRPRHAEYLRLLPEFS